MCEVYPVAFDQGRTSLTNATAARLSTPTALYHSPTHRAAEDRIENELQQQKRNQGPVPAQEASGAAGRGPKGDFYSIGDVVKVEYGGLFMIERYQGGKWVVVALGPCC